MIDKPEERHLNFISQLQEKIESIKKLNVYRMDLETIKLLEKAIFEIQLLMQDNRKLRKKIILVDSLKNKHSKP